MRRHFYKQFSGKTFKRLAAFYSHGQGIARTDGENATDGKMGIIKTRKRTIMESIFLKIGETTLYKGIRVKCVVVGNIHENAELLNI